MECLPVFLRKVILKSWLISKRNKGIGLNELLGIAAVLIITAFVVIPGLSAFTDNVMDGLTSWWSNTIAKQIFPTSLSAG